MIFKVKKLYKRVLYARVFKPALFCIRKCYTLVVHAFYIYITNQMSTFASNVKTINVINNNTILLFKIIINFTSLGNVPPLN